MRPLWKYINIKTREIHFSWERWNRKAAVGFWEFRLPPAPKKVARDPKEELE